MLKTVIAVSAFLWQNVHGGDLGASQYLIKADHVGVCPVMVGRYPCPGVFHAHDTAGGLRNKESGNMLARIDGAYHCGAAADYSVVDGKPQFAKTIGISNTLAECVFSPEFCPTLKVDSNSDKCISGDYSKESTWRWRLADRSFTLHPTGRMNAEDDLNYNCYSEDDKAFVGAKSSNIRMSTQCINDLLPESPKYGYNYADGETVYVTGPKSPLGFAEGSFYRLFQMDTPEDGSTVTVFPYGARMWDETVTKVALHSAIENEALVQPIIITDAGPGSFRLRLGTEGGNPGSRRVNVLQVAGGVHNHLFDSTKVVIASTITTFKESEPTYRNYHSNYTFATGKFPIILVQVANTESNISMYRLHSRTETQFGVRRDSGDIHYIAVLAGGRSSGLFGPNMLAATTAESTNEPFATHDKYTVNLDGVGFTSAPITFVDLNSLNGNDPALTRVVNSSASEFSYEIHEQLDYDGSHGLETVVSLTLGFEYNPEDTVSSTLSHQNVGCPYLHSDHEGCRGLFKATGDAGQYESVDGRFTITQLSNTHHKCLDIDGALVHKGNFATCALYNNFCSKITVHTGNCRGLYTRTAPGYWRNEKEETLIHYSTDHDADLMTFKCFMTDKTYWESALYTCHNEYIQSGVRYGLNKVNGDNVYVVGAAQMSQSGYHRLFKVQTPADNGSMTVYPMSVPWADTAVVKLTPQNPTNASVVPYITYVEGSSFRVKMVPLDCDSPPGSMWLNVMQIKRGSHSDPWNQIENVTADIVETYNRVDAVFPVPYASRPIVLVQIQKGYNVPANNYLYARIHSLGNIKAILKVQGHTNTFDEAWRADVGYISMMYHHDHSSNVLFGNLRYQALRGKSDLDEENTFTQDIAGYNFVEEPLVFIDTHSMEYNKSVYPAVDSISDGSVKFFYGVDHCFEDEVITSDQMEYNMLIVGKEFFEKNSGWSANRAGCPHMKSFYNCAGDYFAVDNQTSFATGADNGNKTVGYFADRTMCCNPGTVNANGHCSGPLISGHAIGQCQLETHCDKLEVFGRGEADGIYYQKNRWAYFKESDEEVRLALRADKSGKLLAELIRNDEGHIATFYSKEVNCLVERGIKDGRLEHGPTPVYKVGDALHEGPGDAFQANTEDDFTSDLVHYKFFQMTVKASDSADGLYTYVGGTTWTGGALAFGSMGLKSDTALGLSFDNVTPTALIVKPLVPSCVTDFTEEKVNVFIMKPGTFASDDGSLVLHAQSEEVNSNKRIAFPADPIQIPSIFTSVQGNPGSFIIPRIQEAGRDFVEVLMQAEGGASSSLAATVAVMVVSLNREFNPMRFGNLGTFRAVSIYMGAPSVQDTLVNFDTSIAEFYSEPFVLAQSQSAESPLTSAVRVADVGASHVELKLVADQCGSSSAAAPEKWAALAIGESLRRKSTPNSATLNRIGISSPPPATTTTTTAAPTTTTAAPTTTTAAPTTTTAAPTTTTPAPTTTTPAPTTTTPAPTTTTPAPTTTTPAPTTTTPAPTTTTPAPTTTTPAPTTTTPAPTTTTPAPTTTTPAPTTTTPAPTTTTPAPTTTRPTTTTTTIPCSPADVNLEIMFVAERSLSFCGEETCPYISDGEHRLSKTLAIKNRYFDMMAELQSEFNSVKMGYSEFVDKPVEPRGQPGADYCLKFMNSLTPVDASYRAHIEEHWDRTWRYSGSGMDMTENQLDAMITSMQKGDWSTGGHSPDGKYNLRVLFVITDKAFHVQGEGCPNGGPCAAYDVDAKCNCLGSDYPSVQQLLDVAGHHQVNMLFNIQDPQYETVTKVYEGLADLLHEVDPGLVAKTIIGGTPAGPLLHAFDPEMVKNGLNEMVDRKCRMLDALNSI